MPARKQIIKSAILVVILVTILSACDAKPSKSVIDGNQEATKTPYQQELSIKIPFRETDPSNILDPTPTPWIDIEYPPDTRTGIEEIDLVIDAIMSQDIDAKIELVHFFTSACTTMDGLGGPPKCEPNEQDGTIVEAFPVAYSEGVQIRPEQIRAVFDFTIRGLFAIYRVPDDAYEKEYWPVGEYALVFTSEDGGHSHTITIHVINGKIVRLEFDMVWPPFDQIWIRSDTFILPPSTRKAPTPF